MTQPNAPSRNVAIVGSYTPRFLAAIPGLLSDEGGLVDDPTDRGGVTHWGISLRFLASEGAFDADGDGKADFDLDMDGDIDGQDVRLLTRDDATALYFRCFWQKLAIDTLPIIAPIGEMMFNQGVNGGLVTARKLLQRAINSSLMLVPPKQCNVAMLTVDGDIGQKTMTAMRFVMSWPTLGAGALASAYRDAVRERYRDIVRRYPDQQRFLKGWLARADRLGK